MTVLCIVVLIYFIASVIFKYITFIVNVFTLSIEKLIQKQQEVCGIITEMNQIVVQ